MRQIHDRARVIATRRIGQVVDRNADGSLYLVEFEGDESTRRWYRDSELLPVNSPLHFVRTNSSKVFRAAASGIAFLVPPGAWYRTALQASRLQALILKHLIELTPYRRDSRRSILVAWLLNSWLQQLNKIKRAFPIEVKTEGQSALINASAHPWGVVICSVHLPLVHTVLQSLVDIGFPPASVVAGEREMRDGKIQVWGLQADLPGIPENQYVLLKMRGILRQGGSIFALVDTQLGDSPSHNIFRLIGKVGARALLAVPALRPTGEIAVKYFEPPDPFCRTEQSIVANLTFLQAAVNSIVYGRVAADEDFMLLKDGK